MAIIKPHYARYSDLDGPPSDALEEAYSETISAMILRLVQTKETFPLPDGSTRPKRSPGDISVYAYCSATTEPVGHEKTFGPRASDRRFRPSRAEYYTIIRPLLYGPSKRYPQGPILEN